MKRFSTAIEMYANSQGFVCDGPDQCHFCSAPCKRVIPHNDKKPITGYKYDTDAKLPGNVYMCVGCWLWQRERITVPFLNGGLKDCQTPKNWGWLIEPGTAKGIRLKSTGTYEPGDDRMALVAKLLKPPHQFALSLVRPGVHNKLYRCPVNDNAEVRADTELRFAIDNREFTYTVYELEAAVKEGPEGTENGVQELCRLLGVEKKSELELMIDADLKAKEEKAGPGRPPALVNTARKVIKKQVVLSGS